MSKTLGYYSTGHEQGLLPPDSYVTAIKDEDWYKEFELHFNNLLMLYYSERTVFNLSKYPSEDSKDTITYNQLRHDIATILLSKAYVYKNLYGVSIAEYNPLWNVDGIESTVRTLEQTGTDTFAKEGSDTTSNSGSDTTTGQQTTYDTTFLDTDKSTLSHGLESETAYDSTNTETKDLLDTERITLERHGNIGVTKSSELLADTVDLYQGMDIWKWITEDICNQISYALY